MRSLSFFSKKPAYEGSRSNKKTIESRYSAQMAYTK